MIRQTIILLLFIIAGHQLIAQDNTAKKLQQQRVALQRELTDLAQKLNHTDNSLYSSVKQRILLQQQMAARKREISVLDRQLQTIEHQLQHTDESLHSMYTRLNNLKKSYATTLALSWKLMNQPQVMQVVFTAGNANTEQQRMHYIKILRQIQLRQVNSIRQLQYQYNTRKQQLGNEQVKTNNRLQKEMVVSEELSGKEQVLTAKERQLQKTKDALRLMVKRKKDQQRIIENRLMALLVEPKAPPVKTVIAGGKGKTGKKEPLKTEMVKGNNAFRLNKGKLSCPVEGSISLRFGKVKIEEQDFDHLFLTFSTPAPGYPVTAVFSGEVYSVSKEEEVFTILVKHGDIYTVYSNLASVSVQKGEAVNNGTVIGRNAINSGNGKSELEFGIFENKRFINPERWINCR